MPLSCARQQRVSAPPILPRSLTRLGLGAWTGAKNVDANEHAERRKTACRRPSPVAYRKTASVCSNQPCYCSSATRENFTICCRRQKETLNLSSHNPINATPFFHDNVAECTEYMKVIVGEQC
eukprot:194499-Pleurochrysis_carterae.AAC.2